MFRDYGRHRGKRLVDPRRSDLRRLRHAASRRFTAASNWKLAVENFVDFHHLPTVPQGSNRFSAMADHCFVVAGGAVFGQGNRHYRPADDVTGVFPSFPGLDGEGHRTTEAVCSCPELLITIFPDNLRIIRVEPDGATRCHARVELFLIEEDGLDPELRPQRDALMAHFESFDGEDIQILQSLLRCMATTALDGAARITSTATSRVSSAACWRISPASAVANSEARGEGGAPRNERRHRSGAYCHRAARVRTSRRPRTPTTP